MTEITTILDLVQETTPLSTDVIYIVIDPGGTPEDRYITLANLMGSIQGAMVIDISTAEALLVRKDGDTGDVFTVNTSTAGVLIAGTLGITGIQTLNGKLIIDEDNVEAILVRKDGDGGDIFLVDTTNSEVEITGLKAMTKAVFNSEVGYDGVVDNGNSGAADTIVWTAGNAQKSTLTGDCTFTFTAPANPCHLTLVLIGDGTPRTLTWPASVKWLEPDEPTWSGTNGAKSIMSMFYDGTDYIASGAIPA